MPPTVPTTQLPIGSNVESLSPHVPQKSPRFPELDGLRGFAAVGIAIIHYLIGPSHKLPILDRIINLLEMSPLSLDIFFILSGFLIGGILLRTRTAPDYYKTFYRRRFYRILPLYYVWIALFCLFYFTAQGWGLNPPQIHSGVFYLASYIFLFQNFFPTIIRSTYIVQPTWTLVVEEHFYLLVPLCVRRMSSRLLVKSLLGVLVLAPIFRGVLFRFVGNRSDWADIAARIWPPCRADALAMGVLLAIIWQSLELRAWLQKHTSLLIWGMFAGTSSAILLNWMANSNFQYCRFLNVSFGRTAVEFACLCLISHLISRPQSLVAKFLSTNFMRELGKISYCLYLVHWGVLWMIFRFVFHTRFGDHLWLDFTVAPIALLVSIGIAQLSWKYFELPLLLRARGVTPPAQVPSISDRQPQTVTATLF